MYLPLGVLSHSLIQKNTTETQPRTITMHARNAAGRKVSLLNDDSSNFAPTQQRQLPHELFNPSYAPAPSYPTTGTAASSPNVPELLRSDSYDSQMSVDPASPLTPNVDYWPRQASKSIYAVPKDYTMSDMKPSSYAHSTRSASYDGDMTGQTATSPPERSGKRYPCRYRESHGCEKTFTTSGHASRHSKIHTAEKAVQCTFVGCSKKFTRADNMKQHLETHFKDKSRAGPQRGQKLADSRRNSSSGRPTLSRDHKSSRRDANDPYPRSTPPLSSPVVGTSWAARPQTLTLLNRPAPDRTPSGLDTLALAIACQENA